MHSFHKVGGALLHLHKRGHSLDILQAFLVGLRVGLKCVPKMWMQMLGAMLKGDLAPVVCAGL